MAGGSRTLAKIAYGALFVAALPVLLVMWARWTAPLVPLPVYGNRGVSAAAACAGVCLMAAGMWQLWRTGGGLPLNAFPPERLVTTGIFALIPHPIYAGFTILCWAIAMWAESASGLWLVTPVAALCCAALVLGYERRDLESRFGERWRSSGLVLPADADRGASFAERARALLTGVLPLLALVEITARVNPPGAGISMGAWLAAVVGVLLARDARALRRFMIQSWAGICVAFPLAWALPTVAPSAFVLWAILAAAAVGAGRPGSGWALTLLAAVAAGGAVIAEKAPVASVVAAVVLALAILDYERAWGVLRRAAEAVANSWHQWHVGPVRIINHGFYAGLGTATGLCLITAATGDQLAGPVMLTVIGGVVGAGLWAQFVEGSPRLLRPYGFYGGLLGVIVTCMFFDSAWRLMGAHSLAGPWVQAIGRLRCLVQGCCHGAAASPEVGIVYRRAESRVTRLAGLGGVPVHATQVYSILWNVFTGLMLLRVWGGGASLNLVGGLWLILNGIGRFAEEAYRGEPQTKIFAGLRFYQWMAMASVLGGVIASSVQGVALAPPLALGQVNVPLVLAGFCLTSFALGVDFPGSERRFARLT